MRRLCRRAALFLFFLVAPFPLHLAAAEPPSAPSVAGVEVNQVGATELYLRLTGYRLPRPRLVADGGVVEFFLPEASIASGSWSRDYPFPLLSRVSLSTEAGGLLMALTTGGDVALVSIEGGEGSGAVEIRLRKRTSRPVQDESPVPVLPLPQPTDPMAKTTPVSLELRGVDLRDVFRMLGRMVGKNLIVDPSVPGDAVTLSLKEVPLNQAFGYLMRMYGVSYALMGDTLVVGTPSSLGQTMGMDQTRGFKIAYGDPQKIPGLLAGLANVDRVVVDERLRTVYVTGRPEQLREVEKVLRSIDHPGRQVMVQAKLLEVTEEGSKSLETTIEAVYKNWWLTFGSTGTQGGYVYTNNPDSYAPNADRTIKPYNISLGDIVDSTTKMLDVGIKAVVSRQEGKVLASPSVVTLDGVKASVKLIDKFIYQSGQDEAGNPSTESEEVGPTLEFTPLIGRDGNVRIELNIETGDVLNASAATEGKELPQTTKRSVKTSVVVRNGEPFVVGGLFKEQSSFSSWKIPVLGDIPLLGELFKGRSRSMSNSEVVMVVVPYILDISESAPETFDL